MSLHYWIPVLATCLFLTACGDTDSNKNPNRESTLGDEAYSKASCAFGYDEGEKASTFSDSQYAYSYFGKTYDRSHLLGIASASAKETVEYIEKTKVHIYKIKSQMGQCQMFAALPPAPQALQKVWNDRRPTRPDGGTIIGRYFPPQFAANEIPAIALRSDTDRWTLVHEFFHHLFHKEFTGEAELIKRYSRSYREFEKIRRDYLSDRTAESTGAYTQSVLALFEMEDFLRVGSVFEEAAIEAELMELYTSGTLSYVAPQAFDNAKFYINSSANKAIEVYSEHRSLLDDLLSLNHSYGNYEHDKALHKAIATIDSRISVVQDLQWRYVWRGGHQNFEGTALAPVNTIRPCVHASRFDDIIGDLN